MRTEWLAHHLKFLQSCQEKSIIPRGLLLDKTINPIKTRSNACVNDFHVQIKEILTNASKQILAKLVAYYNDAIVKEQLLLQSLDNELTKLKLSFQEMTDLKGFRANISRKKEAIRAKLDKRRVNKLEKLLKSTREQPQAGTDPRPPHKKGKKKQE